MKFINKKTKILSYLPQILAMLFLAGFIAYAWTEPSQPPPDGNVAAPINVSANSQTFQDSKTLKVKNDGTGVLNLLGGLGVNGLFRAFSDAIFNDKVGIGTTNPQGLLDVGGGKFVVTTEGATNFTAGPNSPISAVNDGGSNWITPNNAKISDNSYALTGSGPTSNYLKITGFSFSIPGAAVIDGIKAEIEKKGSATPPYDLPMDYEVKIVKNGAIQGANHAAGFWPSTDTYVSHGGSTDKWGLIWTPADINSADFGVAISVQLSGDPDDGWGTASVDHIRITVYYHTGGTDVAKVGSSVTIKGDGSLSTNLNADKLDGLDSTEFGKQGLYGLCKYHSSNPYNTSNCGNVFPPAYCTTSGFYQICNCSSGFTLVMIADSSFPSNIVYNYSCYKN